MVSKSLVQRHAGIATVVVLAAASIAAMLFLGIQAANRFNATETSWRQYNDQTRNISKSLNALQNHLGYGGFIHNFKNFVLRHDPAYLEHVERNATDAFTEIAVLQAVLPSPEEQALLNDVRLTIENYLEKKGEALDFLDTLSVRELDDLVRVDDTAALRALGTLQKLNENRSFQQEINAQASFDKAMSTLKQGSFVVLLILAGASGMIVLLIRAARINTRLNASLGYIEQLYNDSPNALVSVDSKGRIFQINRQAERLLGRSIIELSGRALHSLIPEGFDEQRRSLSERLIVGAGDGQAEGSGLQMAVRRNDGLDIPVHLRIRVVGSVDGAFFLVALVDITEIATLHEELRIARQNAEAASEAKSRFLTSMSHEIRTPLNGILGLLQLIDKHEVTPEIAQKLAIAKESGLFLLTLINQVLDFARIEAGQITLSKERFSLPVMMDAMESMFRIRAEMKGLEFSCTVTDDGEMFLYGDFDHIRQILFNLIGNAIKFTETGRVDLRARSQMQADGTCCRITFEVSDTGPGIAEDEIGPIFEEFKQTEVGIRQGAGTGLGLNISKRIADAIGAKLSVESTVGAGTTFRLEVEAEVAHNQEVVDETVEGTTLPSLRILVAEDNDINQMITRAMLERDGHTVTIANDGEIAVNLVRQNPDAFDLILMDIQMPNMDGVQATVSIRQFARDGENLPIIGLTANAFQDQKEEYLGAGMQFVLTKPLEIPDLRSALGRYMPERFRKTVSSHQGGTDRAQHPDLPAAGGHFDQKILTELKGSIPPGKLKILRDNARTRSGELIKALSVSGIDAEETCRIAHELSGMLGNFGLKSAVLKAQEIGRCALQGAETSGTVRELEDILQTSWRILEQEPEDSDI